jgi:hypothetical protein
MLKVVTIMTGRYKKILKRGEQDKVKLLFRSLAVFDRRASMSSPQYKPQVVDLVNEQLPDDMRQDRETEREITSSMAGFAIDQPANDDEEEDEDDLALAALDSLDAIEVFKQDQKVDRKIHHAIIPTENFKKLVLLLLLLAGLEPLDALGTYGESLDDQKILALNTSADAILAAFDPDTHTKGIRYSNFVKTMTVTLPDLFDPFNALFEHFLFSRNINLSKHRDVPDPVPPTNTKQSPIYTPPGESTSTIFTDTLLSQLSTSLKLYTPTNSLQNIFTSSAKFNQLYSTSTHGTSLSSFSRQVLSWQSGTLVLIAGTFPSPTSNNTDNIPITIGAYLPTRWHDSQSSSSTQKSTTTPSDPSGPRASLFQLSPRQAIFPANPYNHSTPVSYFSSKTGIALGCVIPQQSRSGHAAPSPPILGPVSIHIDADMETATFQHDGEAGTGAFTTDPGLEIAQARRGGEDGGSRTQTHTRAQPKKVSFEIDALEVWGISFPVVDGEDEMTKQKKRLAWEEAEAARRRGVNFGGDKDGARALLEMAGLVGDKAGVRSGGSV